MKKINIRALKRRTWQALSKSVRAGARNCISCGTPITPETCDAGHFHPNTERNMSLGGNALWYDSRNINCQCLKCNRFASGNLVGYTVWLENKYGYGIVQELDKLYRTYKLWTVEELQNLINKYESISN
jgi:hypothetical protein